MDIIGHRNKFLITSAILVITSWIFLGVWWLKPGLDFTGGSLLEIEFTGERPAGDLLKKKLEPLVGQTLVQPTGDKGIIFRFKEMNEEKHQEALKIISAIGQFSEKRFDSIGPTIGRELRYKSIWALGLALIAIVIYIAWAFRQVSEPVSSWKYGVTAILALLHDVSLPAGVFSILGRFRGVEIDTLFITALLTILGFSVHDTIVVFDRIRENLNKLKRPELFETTVNRSVNETLARSVNTSLTVLLVLLAVFYIGGETTRYFSLALILGIVFGTYSSIFIASSLLVVWYQFNSRRSK